MAVIDMDRPRPAFDPSSHRLTIVGTDPPYYLLHVDDHIAVKLKPRDLADPKRFHVAYMAATRRLPPRLTQDQHDAMVAGWLDRAEWIELSEEAGETGGLREMLRMYLDDPPRGDDRLDLLRRRAVEIDGHDHIQLVTVVQHIADHWPGKPPPQNQIAAQLRDLGWHPLDNAIRVGATTARVWVREVARCDD